MPKIEEFNGGNLSVRPNDAAVEGAVQAGRRIGGFYSQIASGQRQAGEMDRRVADTFAGDLDKFGKAYDEHLTNMEVSHGLATYATSFNGLSQQWNETAKNADPNDPTVAQKFRDETLKPWADQFTSSFKTSGGKRWAQTKVAELTQHMYEKTAADMSTLAGNAVIQNLQTSENQFSEAAMNDPSAHDIIQEAARANIRAAIQANPNLTAEEASKVASHYTMATGTEIAKSAAYGAISANPQAGRELLASGKLANYLDGDQVKALDGYAQTVQKAGEEAKKAAVAEQRKAEDDEFKGALGKAQLSMVRPDGSVLPSADFYKNILQIAALPGAARNPSEIKSLIEMAATARKNQEDHVFVQSDPTTYTSLSQRVGLPVGQGGLSASEVNTAYAQNRLSDHDFTKLHEMIEKNDSSKDPAEKELTKRRTEFLEGMKLGVGDVGPLGTFLKPEAASRFYSFQVDTQNREDALKAAGKSPAEIMATMYNPRDSAYQGARVSAYQIGTKEGLAQASAKAAGKAAYVGAPSLSATAEAGIQNAPAPSQPNAAALQKLSPQQQAWIKAHQ